MRLSSKAIEAFKKVHFKRHGIHLTDEEANCKGLELLEIVRFLMQPIPKKDYERLYNNS